MTMGSKDEALVATINRRTGATLSVTGRAKQGTLGGAIFARWQDGRPAVVTRFIGSLAEAEHTAAVLDHVRKRGLPVPRHHLVLDLDGVVFVVQERLFGASPERLTPARIDAIVEVNDRFAGLLEDLPDVPLPPHCLDGPVDPRPRVLAKHSVRSRRVLEEIVRVSELGAHRMRGTDLVHVDLTMPNILFDEEDLVTGVVDWNLGAYRGDRLFALVKTRFDLEWGIHSSHPDPFERAGAAHLDEVLRDRVPSATLRWYWARWLLYQLYWALPSEPAEVVNWHLEVAESRLR